MTPLRKLGFGALFGGGVLLLSAFFVAALFVGPLIFWLAWNVMDFAAAVGLPELGFWAIVLATLFLITGWFGKSLIAAIVFIAHPAWLDGAANAHWPEPTFKNFVAVMLLAILASRPHAHAHKNEQATRKRADQTSGGPWVRIDSAMKQEHPDGPI